MIPDVSNGYVNAETHNGVTTIEFFHPKSNALPAQMLDSLAREIHSAGTDEVTRVIIVKSGGEKAFCAGASFDELSMITTPEQGKKFFSGFAHVINTMRKCPKLIIGRIQGNCIGGGVGLAASVDYCIAWEKTEIRLSELAIGIGPFVVGPAIERKIGTSAFSQLAIDSAMWRNADWAKRKGLFAEVHSSVENMDEAILRLANVLTHSDPEAMQELKKVLWRGTDHWDELLRERAAISGRLVTSEFTKKAIQQLKTAVKS